MTFGCGYHRGRQASYLDWLVITSPAEVEHADYELRAYRAAMAALDAGNDAEYRKLWTAFVTIHRTRSA